VRLCCFASSRWFNALTSAVNVLVVLLSCALGSQFSQSVPDVVAALHRLFPRRAVPIFPGLIAEPPFSVLLRFIRALQNAVPRCFGSRSRLMRPLGRRVHECVR